MKTLIIPDIHCKHSRAEAIIQSEEADLTVLLGDYFDEWGDSPEMNAATAEWLRGKLHSDYVECLWGNHDQHYLLNSRRWICSGYDPLKKLAIRAILKSEDTKRLLLSTISQGYLLSHAGFDKRLTGTVWTPYHLRDLANDEVMPKMLDGDGHELLSIPYSRGGDRPVGGITWQDWSGLYPIPGIKQIVGHTEAAAPRWEEENLCLDTRLKHYTIIEDGEVTVKEAK